MVVATVGPSQLFSVQRQQQDFPRYAMREVVIVDSARNDLDPALVDDCIVGAASNEGAQGYNIGRNVAVLSRLGIDCPGMTLNRYCSSGLQAIAMAANQIASGCSDVIVAGGVESISLTLNSKNTDHLFNPIIQAQVPGIYHSMGQTAERVARRYDVTREQQDIYALQSQQRTARAQAAGLFADEIVPMNVRYFTEDKQTGVRTEHEGVVDRDDCNRPDTTLESLSGLKPVFAEDGSVTAGNASQLSDGASMKPSPRSACTAATGWKSTMRSSTSAVAPSPSAIPSA